MSEVDQGTGTPEEPATDETQAESSAAPLDEATETTAEGEEDAPKKVPWFQKRIDSVTAEKWELRRLADQQAAQIAALSQQLKQPETAPAPAAKPTLDQFDGDWEAFNEALTDWKVDQRFQQQEHRRRAETAAEQAAREANEFSAKVQAAAKANPKVLDVASDPTLPVSVAMADVVRSIDNGPDVLLYLDEHRDEAARISRLPAHLAAYEMGRLSTALTPPAKPRRNPPPEPITPLAGGSTVPAVDPNKFKTADEYQAWRLEQLRAKR